MATKNITLFDNYNGYDFEEMKAELKESNEWYEPDVEITDERVWDFISEQQCVDWDNAKRTLHDVFGSNKVVAYGTCGTWQGNREAIRMFDSIDKAIWAILKDCDYYSVEWNRRSGRVIVKGTHHDGTNTFELKVPNERGENMYHEWECSRGRHQSWSEFQITKHIFDKFSHGVKIVWVW